MTPGLVIFLVRDEEPDHPPTPRRQSRRTDPRSRPCEAGPRLPLAGEMYLDGSSVGWSKPKQ